MVGRRADIRGVWGAVQKLQLETLEELVGIQVPCKIFESNQVRACWPPRTAPQHRQQAAPSIGCKCWVSSSGVVHCANTWCHARVAVLAKGRHVLHTLSLASM
jgi:hypothetical protein